MAIFFADSGIGFSFDFSYIICLYKELMSDGVVIKPSSSLEMDHRLENIFEMPHPLDERSINQFVNNAFENPEGRLTSTQRMFILMYSVFEVYRTVISSYLIVFVPQNCDGYSCTISQNCSPTDELESAAISMNTLMAAYFCGMFLLEKERERTVKRHLIVDKSSATDKEYLIAMMQSMDEKPREEILRINNWYRVYTRGLLLFFFVNIGVSGTVIYKNYLNNTTATVFITNALFMINRIYKAIRITSSGEYNIYSAYRSDSILYNRDRTTWLKKETESALL